MPIYRVELDETDKAGMHQAHAMLVSAEDATDAVNHAKAQFDGDANDAWAAATATVMPSDVTAATALAFVGWRARVTISAPTQVAGAATVISHEVNVVGDSTDDTLDEMGDALEAALDALGLTALYTSATQVLIAATGSGGDDLGDQKLEVEFLPPTTLDGADDAPCLGLVASITDEGAATDNLSATLAADTFVMPVILQTYRRV